MAQKLLVTDYHYNCSTAELEATLAALAPAFAQVPGCLWKISLLDAAQQQAGGVYLFRDEAALEAFKAGPLVAQVLAHPALSRFDLKTRDVLREISEVTRAPLGAAVPAPAG
jgi:quinol monooxygenase YgiN